MLRTLTSRGLAVVSVGLVVTGLSAAPASAQASRHPGHHVVVSGTWSDPGAIIDSATPQGDKYLVHFHGGTTTTGGFVGTSTYRFTVLFDPVTNESDGRGRETFTARLRDGRSGHVTFADHARVTADGTNIVNCRILSGDGVFRGARGFAHFVGRNVPAGASSLAGSYRMVLDLRG